MLKDSKHYTKLLGIDTPLFFGHRPARGKGGQRLPQGDWAEGGSRALVSQAAGGASQRPVAVEASESCGCRSEEWRAGTVEDLTGRVGAVSRLRRSWRDGVHSFPLGKECVSESNEGRSSPLNNQGPREEKWLLSKVEVCQRLGICLRTLEREISRGRYPRPLKIGKASRWEVGDVVAYIERLAQERQPEGSSS